MTDKEKCSHTIQQHQRMEEVRAELAEDGIKTNKTTCEILDISGHTTTEKSREVEEFKKEFFAEGSECTWKDYPLATYVLDWVRLQEQNHHHQIQKAREEERERCKVEMEVLVRVILDRAVWESFDDDEKIMVDMVMAKDIKAIAKSKDIIIDNK